MRPKSIVVEEYTPLDKLMWVSRWPRTYAASLPIPNFPIVVRPLGVTRVRRLIESPTIQWILRPSGSIPVPLSNTAIEDPVWSKILRHDPTSTVRASASKEFDTSSSMALLGLLYSPSEKSPMIW